MNNRTRLSPQVRILEAEEHLEQARSDLTTQHEPESEEMANMLGDQIQQLEMLRMRLQVKRSTVNR